MSHLGKFLKETLKGKGITQNTLAGAIATEPKVISRIVTRRCKLTAKMAVRLEHALGIDAATLLMKQAQDELDEARKQYEGSGCSIAAADIGRNPFPHGASQRIFA